MPLSKNAPPSLRAREFYSQIFCPSYESFFNAAKQTPLVIMLWGPRQRTHEWFNNRQHLRNELQRLGHTVFFSEQLGIPASAVAKKGVEFLQSETTDLIVAMQSRYDAVGTAHHFAEFRVVAAKMFLFIDETAPDEHLYLRARTELKTRYNNIETYKFPQDIIQDTLLKKILAKVGLMQMVKYRATQRARSWRFGSYDYSVDSASPSATLQPFRYNLLELYREHRDEVDVLSDSTALFFLAYVNFNGHITLQALSNEVGLEATSLLQEIALLKRGEMLLQSNETLSVTGFGKRILENAELAAPVVPLAAPRPSVIWHDKRATIARGAGLALAAAMMLIFLGLSWSNVVQSQLPLAYTPTSPTVTATTTRAPTPLITLTPPGKR